MAYYPKNKEFVLESKFALARLSQLIDSFILMQSTFLPEILISSDKRRQIRKLRKLFGIMRVKPVHIITPIILSFIVAAFSGISLGLLIPMAQGIVSNDFSFVASIPVLGTALRYFLGNIGFGADSNRLILVLLIGFILTAQVLKNVTGYASNVLIGYWNTKFTKNISSALFDRYLTFGKLYFDRASHGELQTIMGYAREVLALLNSFNGFMSSAFFIAAHFAVMFIISWKLTLLTTILFPAFYYSIRGILGKISNISNHKKTESLRIGRKIYNIFSNISLIKTCSREEEASQLYDNLLERNRKLEFRSVALICLVHPLHEIIFILLLLVIALFVSFFLTSGTLVEIPVFVVFLYTARETLPRFLSLGTSRSDFANLKGPVTEILRVFEDTDKFKIPDGGKELSQFTESIIFNKTNFSYTDDVPVLRSLDMIIEKGKVTALVGETGSGKTTIVNLILRMYDCPPNSIFIDGTDIRDYRIASLHRKMAYVSQEPLLFNDTFLENLTFGLDTPPSESQIYEVIDQARLRKFIDSLPQKLNTEIGDHGMQLSGGEKQRLSIARALLKNADIFIFDEATSSLDSQTEKLIQEAIQEAIHDCTAIIIAHRLFTIQHADNIIVIDEGKVVEEGTLKELQDKEGLFHSYWQTQQFF